MMHTNKTYLYATLEFVTLFGVKSWFGLLVIELWHTNVQTEVQVNGLVSLKGQAWVLICLLETVQANQILGQCQLIQLKIIWGKNLILLYDTSTY